MRSEIAFILHGFTVGLRKTGTACSEPPDTGRQSKQATGSPPRPQRQDTLGMSGGGGVCKQGHL